MFLDIFDLKLCIWVIFSFPGAEGAGAENWLLVGPWGEPSLSKKKKKTSRVLRKVLPLPHLPMPKEFFGTKWRRNFPPFHILASYLPPDILGNRKRSHWDRSFLKLTEFLKQSPPPPRSSQKPIFGSGAFSAGEAENDSYA